MFRKTRTRLAALAVAIAAAGSGALVVGPARAADAPAAVTINVADSKLGRILVDAKGNTLYMFATDARNVSSCEGGCLNAWPALMLPKGGSLADVALASPNLRRSWLGVALRSDGSQQVTYNGFPLYYWFRDAKPGDVNGQWITNNWFVMNDNGAPVITRV